MSLRELYQEVIIDHGRKPRNFSITENADLIKIGHNPLCGDKITLYVSEKNGVINTVTFQGSGCAISMASASMMTEVIQGKTTDEVKTIFTDFHQVVTHNDQQNNLEHLGKLAALSGVAEYPARVKCATLAWHTLMSALQHDPNLVSTE